MKPSELKSYFRTLADEPDSTFLTDADVTLYLNLGYNRFRKEVSDIDPLIYATYVDITVSDSREVDLTTISMASGTGVLGNSVAAGNRLMQIVSLEAVTSDGATKTIYTPVASKQALVATLDSYIFRGQKLRFEASVSDTLRLTYLPEHNVDWTNSSNQLDDLVMYHDIIALFAYQQYAMRDGGANNILLQQLAMRLNDLKGYVNSRNLDSSSYVSRVAVGDSGWL